MSALSKEEIERYSRQILLRGIAAQQTLKSAKALVIGAGGLGATLLPLLASAGIGSITLYDDDSVERSNLGRQYLFRERDIGKNKAITAAAALRDLNPYVDIAAQGRRFTLEDAPEIAKFDILFEGSDSLTTKFLINDLACAGHKPAFIAALGAAQGHAMLVGGDACYRCVFDEISEGELPNCASEGILSTAPAVIGAAVAHAAVEYLLAPDYESKFWIFEKNHCRKVGVRKRHDCKNHAA